MKDLSTGKTHLTRRTKEVAGPAFAKAGYNVENLVDKKQILKAWANTLSDAQADDVLNFLIGKAPPHEGAANPGPAVTKPKLVKYQTTQTDQRKILRPVFCGC
jgi:hypothetical protein